MRKFTFFLLLLLVASPFQCNKFDDSQSGQDLRIITLAPNLTEILCEMGGQKFMVGTCAESNYPENSDVQSVGNFANPSVEAILELKPDYVFTGGKIHQKFRSQIKELGIDCVDFEIFSLRTLFDSIRTIGSIIGYEIAAEKVIFDIEQNIKEVYKKSQQKEPVSMLFLIWYKPLTSVGRGSFINQMIGLAGGENITEELIGDYGQVSMDLILHKDPEVILLVGIPNAEKIHEEILANDIWQSISAVKNKRVYYNIDPDILLRPGPRIDEGINAIFNRLHSPQSTVNSP